MIKKKKISICIPSYNEEDNILTTYKALTKTMRQNKKYDYELIFVDNCSLDKTRALIEKIAQKDKKVKGIFLSRNFGPESSGQAGLDNVTGDAFIGIGCDLQDPPELISQFIKKWEQGYDIILGVYKKLDDNLLMKIIRSWFYNFLNKISNITIPSNSVGYGLYDKKVINALKLLPEKYRFGRGLTAWVGFKKISLSYERKRRLKGKSSYNFFEYVKDAERGVFGFSYLVLDIMIYGGFLLTLISFLFILGYLYWVVFIDTPFNASIPILLAIFFFGGVTLLAISIIGKYIQIIVEETKNRPMYIVEDTINIKN